MAKFSIEKMKEIIKTKGYTYQELSNITQMSKSSISKIFAGFSPNPTLKHLQMIAQALDCSIDDFFDWEGAEPQSPYYTERKTLELMQLLTDDADKRTLLRLTQALKQEDIKLLIQIAERLQNTN